MMDIDGMLRFENKYIISAAQDELLKCRITGICFQDDFAGNTGGYTIRSLYFDDYAGSAYRENEIGIEPRSKFRIRIYNAGSDVIFLEQKMKTGGKIHKERVQVSREFCELLLRDEWQRIDYPTESAVFNRFLTAYHTKGLRPRIIVEYDRDPYVYPEGDVRITFDRNISFSDEVEHFFEEDIFLQPVMETGMELLEVKFKEFLPDYIYQGINLRQLQQHTFSKYYLSEMHRRKMI